MPRALRQNNRLGAWSVESPDQGTIWGIEEGTSHFIPPIVCMPADYMRPLVPRLEFPGDLCLFVWGLMAATCQLMAAFVSAPI